MKRKQKIFAASMLRFKRFAKKTWSAFCSVQRQVTIGRVSSDLADCSMVKQSVALFAFIALTTNISAEPIDGEMQDVVLQEVEVVSAQPTKTYSEQLRLVYSIDKAKINSIAPATIVDLLRQLPGVDIRQRGANMIQADVSLRAGSFDQVIILLNGLNITDSQTGHFSLDIPVDLSQVEKIELLQGNIVGRFGVSAFSGAINIITHSSTENSMTVDTRVGMYNSTDVGVSGNYHKNDFTLGANANYSQSTGYIDNTDYILGSMFLQGRLNNKSVGELNMQLGYQDKAFGANSFYSASYPMQFEKTKAIIAGASWSKRISDFVINASALYRWHYDQFRLFRDIETAPSWYKSHNYHISNSATLNISGSYYSSLGKTTVGVSLVDNHILSNVLGDKLETSVDKNYFGDAIVFTNSKNRVLLSYFAEQTFEVYDFSASVGVAGQTDSQFGTHVTYGANLGYNIQPDWNVYANFAKAVRTPTFTDLYYKSASQLANPNLKPEQSHTLDIGTKYSRKYISGGVSLFYRWGRDIIDWVKLPEDEVWMSENLTSIDAVGGEIFVAGHYGRILRNIGLTYSNVNLNKQSGIYQSKYALDYLNHKVTADVEIGIYKGVAISLNGSYGVRNATNIQLATPEVWLLNGELKWQINKLAKIYVRADNMLNYKYYDHSGVLQPGFWLKVGTTIKI